MALSGYQGTVVQVVPAHRTRAYGHKTHAKHPQHEMTLCLHYPLRSHHGLTVVQTDQVTCQWCIDRLSAGERAA